MLLLEMVEERKIMAEITEEEVNEVVMNNDDEINEVEKEEGNDDRVDEIDDKQVPNIKTAVWRFFMLCKVFHQLLKVVNIYLKIFVKTHLLYPRLVR